MLLCLRCCMLLVFTSRRIWTEHGLKWSFYVCMVSYHYSLMLKSLGSMLLVACHQASRINRFAKTWGRLFHRSRPAVWSLTSIVLSQFIFQPALRKPFSTLWSAWVSSNLKAILCFLGCQRHELSWVMFLYIGWVMTEYSLR